MNKKHFPMLVVITLILLITWTVAPQNASAAVPGLPFTEDFTDTALLDAGNTNANWSTDEEALLLNWREARYGVFDAGLTGSNISADAHDTWSIGLGDMDGDGDLDLLAGNKDEVNCLYLNNGTANPFSGVTGSDISSDAHNTYSIAMGDVDGDGDLDLLAGNFVQPNRLYLNNGTADPFSGVAGSNISGDAHWTYSIALADMDGDGDLDLLAVNYNQTNRLYLNNGTADPFSGIAGLDITSDASLTASIAIGDVDGDGNLDMLAGNFLDTNRLYLNNGTADPFSGVTGSNISGDADDTLSIALGDVDGDGDLDMLAGNSVDTNRLYLNDGTADPFNGVSGSDISSDTHSTSSIALGDVDGDGDLDLLAGNYSNQTNRLYLNEGTSNPFNGVTGTVISIDTPYTMSIALGDMDGDGDLDLVAGDYGSAHRLYLNDGTSTPFSGVTGTDISTDTGDTFSIALGDVDGDGDLDLVVGNYAQVNRLYLNDGTASPFNGVSGTDISIDTDATRTVTLGDVDGDGDLDLIAGNQNQANRLYLNNGTATPFSGVFGSDISSDTDGTYAIALGDVDGDGDLDLLAGNYNETNRLYLNNGTATPFSGVFGSDISSDTNNTMSIALGDVDGDGDLDLAEVTEDQANRLYLNNGTADPFSGVAGSDISSDTHDSWSIVLADVDGDGDLDMLEGNQFQTNRLYLNNGTADPFSGVTGSNISSETDNTRTIVLGDVDGDGDLDLLAGNSNQTNRLYLNRRTSVPFNVVTASKLTTDTGDTYSIALGDVDGDGDLDLVAGNYLDTNRLYLNNGTADPFGGVAGANISTDAHRTYCLVLADVDGDGDLDLLAGNYLDTNRLYLNNGTTTPFSGLFGSDISIDTDGTYSIALGDVDGDGDLDMLAGNYGDTNRLYLNNGTATPFSGVTGSDISTDVHDTWSVALGDVDGDGDLDMLAGNYGQTNRMYKNNGTADPFGTVVGSDVHSSTLNTTSVAVADVDGDGHLDLVTGNYQQTNRLYLNNGSSIPFFLVSSREISSDTHQTASIALKDVDGDGDLDMLAGNYQQVNRMYLNDGTTTPFSGGTAGADISDDDYHTRSIVLADMDGDGDLDLAEGNGGNNFLYQQRNNYHTAHGLATSLRVDSEASNIPCATLTANVVLPINTSVTYYLSNNGGAKWYIVQSGVSFTFPTSGMDLRWKVELESLSPILTPRLNQIQIWVEDNFYYLPLLNR